VISSLLIRGKGKDKRKKGKKGRKRKKRKTRSRLNSQRDLARLRDEPFLKVGEDKIDLIHHTFHFNH